MIYEVVCAVCSTEFQSNQQKAKFCSEQCKKQKDNEKWGRIGVPGVSASTVGAISEMACSVELMNKGYAVFRALSPSCICDLIAVKGDRMLRVEVRTGYQGSKGTVTFPLNGKDKGRQDVFAVYVRSNKTFHYFDFDKRVMEI